MSMSFKTSVPIFIVVLSTLFAIGACSGNHASSRLNPDFSGYPDTALTINDESQLIGGPTSQGRIGDVLLSNDKIRVIIQKPHKNAGVNSFGGNIIDADIIRPSGSEGQDNFGSLFPLVNIEWTVNYYDYSVISDGSDGSPEVLRAKGKIDVYDYLDLSFISNVAKGMIGQKISYSNRFDDRRNPFDIYDDLKKLSYDVTTDYTLESGKNYVRIDTTFTNKGDKPASLPMGEFINGSGRVSMLIPGIGFSPDLMAQVGGVTPAVLYVGFDDVDVSYGFFFDPTQFKNQKTGVAYNTSSLTYSGVTGVLLGEDFLKILPLGDGAPEIHFQILPKSSKTLTSYFVVGETPSSVMDAGLKAIGASVRNIAGMVVDESGNPVKGAIVSAMAKGATVAVFRSDAAGHFSGSLPDGGNEISKSFAGGQYKMIVDKQGYHLNNTIDAGKCSPDVVDLFTKDSEHVVCTLGETATISLEDPVVDGETGKAIPARLSIVGEDPSPNKVGSAGRFRSTIYWQPVFGISEIKYITANGNFNLTGKNTFNIEPGVYRLVVSHGPEYTDYEKVVQLDAGKTVTLSGVTLNRAIKTPGYISADFHIHSVTSPDSNLSWDLRVLSAAAEGLDVLQSSDHDYLTDYAPIASRLMSEGIIPKGSLKTSVGQEVTPNQFGHFHAFPLVRDDLQADGGAFDWSDSDMEDVSPAPDYVWTLDQDFQKIHAKYPYDEVIQVDHIMDNPTGILVACGWVTTALYENSFGVEPLSSYADPAERRMPPRTGGTKFPIKFGNSGLVSTNFDSVELVIGLHLHNNDNLFKSALPSWFNLLNLGLEVTATADSDSHRGAPNPVGLPRNFIRSSIDPRDGLGSDHDDIDLQEYADNIKAHRLTVSAGPIVMMKATGEDGQSADIGGTVNGHKAKFTVDVTAPSWAWFDSIEIYANTEPIPVDDKTDVAMDGTAKDPSKFYKPYHIPRYTYSSVKAFRLSDGTLKNWDEKDGVISAHVEFEMDVKEDTWVVAVARGTNITDGYRSLFPIVTQVLVDSKDQPSKFDPADLTSFYKSGKVGASAWGFTNPIFIDVDGNGFEAKWVREGLSPLK